MRKRYRAEAANAEPISLVEIDRARIDAEPKPPRQPHLVVGAHVWFIDTNARWYELEVVERNGPRGQRVTFKSVTGWDGGREVEWPYGHLLEFSTSSKLYLRLRHISARRP